MAAATAPDSAILNVQIVLHSHQRAVNPGRNLSADEVEVKVPIAMAVSPNTVTFRSVYVVGPYDRHWLGCYIFVGVL